MTNLDRFQPPHPSEEPRTSCANCGAVRESTDMLYDARAEHYVCERTCYEDWADDNAEKVSEYYYRMNIE